MAREPNWIAVQNPSQGTSVKEQALHLMGQGIAPRFAGDFIRAIQTGLEMKESPKITKLDVFRAVAQADTTERGAIRRAAHYAIFDIFPQDRAANAFLAQDLR
ncbi:MAG: hypothetical protein PHX61_05025 [Alphaproteobacteria bacterium]|nr:hypothetical protein [Alphaproteobacteria bacterium]